jgi:hypothetical protein
MAHQVVYGYAFDSSEFVEVEEDNSPNHSGSGSSSSVDPRVASSISSPPVTFDSESVEMVGTNSSAFCQCQHEDFLVECLTCGSFFDLGTFCPGC